MLLRWNNGQAKLIKKKMRVKIKKSKQLFEKEKKNRNDGKKEMGPKANFNENKSLVPQEIY